ncbi:MAG: hypothetical protein D6748_06950 [Calditrichaeota bacterium]|nr:MAG: hypothetical protein D6748_06950 [Calditrichota bacterium]
MFIGHFGLGLAARKIDSTPSLGTLFLATQFIDLLWPLLLLVGLEKVEIDPGNTAFTPLNFSHYPISHGFLSVLIWSVLFGLVYYLFKKNLKSSLLLGMLVMSHWMLDLITHRPDLPLLPWSEVKVGFGMWNSIGLTMLVESGIFLGGAYLYLKNSRAVNRKGTIGFWGLLLLLGVIYILNVFGDPPPSGQAIAIVGMAQWLIVFWAYWLDKHRLPIP